VRSPSPGFHWHTWDSSDAVFSDEGSLSRSLDGGTDPVMLKHKKISQRGHYDHIGLYQGKARALSDGIAELSTATQVWSLEAAASTWKSGASLERDGVVFTQAGFR